jgi:hypothetical protein
MLHSLGIRALYEHNSRLTRIRLCLLHNNLYQVDVRERKKALSFHQGQGLSCFSLISVRSFSLIRRRSGPIYTVDVHPEAAAVGCLTHIKDTMYVRTW